MDVTVGKMRTATKEKVGEKEEIGEMKRRKITKTLMKRTIPLERKASTAEIIETEHMRETKEKTEEVINN